MLGKQDNLEERRTARQKVLQVEIRVILLELIQQLEALNTRTD
jgi:hypothetical protein